MQLLYHTFLNKVSIPYSAPALVYLSSFQRRKEVISLQKASFANEEIPDPKICRNGEILRINDFRGKKTRPCFLPRKARPRFSNWLFWF